MRRRCALVLAVLGVLFAAAPAGAAHVDPSEFVGTYRLHMAGPTSSDETSAIVTADGHVYSAFFGTGYWSHHGERVKLLFFVASQPWVFRGELSAQGFCAKTAPCSATVNGRRVGTWWAVKKR